MDKQRTNRTPMKRFTYLTLMLHLLFSVTAHSAIPPNYTAIYDVETYSTVVGRSTINLSHDNEKLVYSQVIELVGIAAWFKDDHVSEKSWINKTDDLFLLDKYEYIHSNGDPKKNRDVLLEGRWSEDRQSSEFNGTALGKKTSIKADGTLWDILSVQLALMNDIADSKESLTYQVISKGALNQYTFDLKGPAKIEVKDKQYHTLKAERVSGNKTIRLYLAPKLHNIPVLIEKYKNGKLDTRVLLDTVRFNGQVAESSNDDVFDE